MATTEGLEARVRFLAGEVEGEKTVTRHVLEQAIRNGDVLNALRAETTSNKTDIITITSRLDHIAGNVIVANAALHSHGNLLNVLRQDVGSIRQEVDQFRHQFDQFREEVDRKFEAVDRRFEAIDRRFDSLESRFEAMAHSIAEILAAVRPPSSLPA